MKKYLSFLEKIGCFATPHSGRNMSDHLTGTYTLLRSWGNPESVCLAGLFHSIYGTASFHTACLEYSDRLTLVRLIGQKAELLTFFFSFFSIDDLYEGKECGHKICIDKADMTIALTKWQYSKLVEISLANFIEQYEYVEHIDESTISKLKVIAERIPSTRYHLISTMVPFLAITLPV